MDHQEPDRQGDWKFKFEILHLDSLQSYRLGAEMLGEYLPCPPPKDLRVLREGGINMSQRRALVSRHMRLISKNTANKSDKVILFYCQVLNYSWNAAYYLGLTTTGRRLINLSATSRDGSEVLSWYGDVSVRRSWGSILSCSCPLALARKLSRSWSQTLHSSDDRLKEKSHKSAQNKQERLQIDVNFFITRIGKQYNEIAREVQPPSLKTLETWWDKT